MVYGWAHGQKWLVAPARYTPALRSSRVSHHDVWMVGERAVEGALRAILEMKGRRSPVSIRYLELFIFFVFSKFSLVSSIEQLLDNETFAYD